MLRGCTWRRLVHYRKVISGIHKCQPHSHCSTCDNLSVMYHNYCLTACATSGTPHSLQLTAELWHLHGATRRVQWSGHPIMTVLLTYTTQSGPSALPVPYHSRMTAQGTHLTNVLPSHRRINLGSWAKLPSSDPSSQRLRRWVNTAWTLDNSSLLTSFVNNFYFLTVNAAIHKIRWL